MYKLIIDSDSIIRVSDGAIIPAANSNRHYKEYLAWLEEGNTPEPADIPEPISYEILREEAYAIEADKLFFQEQRGEVPAGTWQAKIDEIKERFPKP